MSQTRPNGTVVPINSDEYNLTPDLAKMADSANTLVPVANVTARNALPALYPGGALPIPTQVFLQDSGGTEIWDGTRWLGTEVPTPLAPTGYSASGSVTVESKGTRKRVTVDITITRTGADFTVSAGAGFSGFGQIIPSAALGTANPKYLVVLMSGAGMNGSTGVTLNPVDGTMGIRGLSAYTWVTGGLFTVNCSYYI